MAAPDIEPHQPPSKTPRQLVIVVALAFAVPVIVIFLLANLATTGMKAGTGSTSAEAVAERIKPVAQVNIAQAGSEAKGDKTGEAASPPPAASEAKGEKSGEQIVQTTCGVCHQTGAAGAPKIGDKAAWAPRIARGEKALLESALKGLRAMPPKGGNPALTDAEVERALIFTVDQSGASFKEPGQGTKAASK